MHFSPDGGFDAAVELLSRYNLPIREQISRDESSQHVQEPIFQRPTTVPTNVPVSERLSQSDVLQHYYKPNERNTTFLQQSRTPSFNAGTNQLRTDFLRSQSQRLFPAEQISLYGEASSQVADLPHPHFRCHTSDGQLEHRPLLHPFNPVQEPTRHPRFIPLSEDTEVRRTLFSEPEEYGRRPATAPIPMGTSIETLTQILPPKRALPFLKPGPTKPAPEPEPELEAMPEQEPEPEPDPAAKPVKPATAKKTWKKAPSKTKKTPTVPVPSPAVEVPPVKSAKPAAQSVTIDSAAETIVPEPKPKPKSTKPRAKRVTAVRKLPAKYVSVGTQTSPPRSLPPTTQQLQPPIPEPAPAHTSAPAPGPTVATEWMEAVELFIREHKDRPAPSPYRSSPAPAAKPVSDLAEYAARPGEERRNAIDDMILELIMDDNFATLCQDIEGCWRRVELGM